jgi:hypothetical protein
MPNTKMHTYKVLNILEEKMYIPERQAVIASYTVVVVMY